MHSRASTPRDQSNNGSQYNTQGFREITCTHLENSSMMPTSFPLKIELPVLITHSHACFDVSLRHPSALPRSGSHDGVPVEEEDTSIPDCA